MTNVFTTVWDLITGGARSLPVNETLPGSVISAVTDDPINLYDALEILYNNDAKLTDNDTTRRLRTVVNRSVEFYASKMMPGDKITTLAKNTAIQAAIEDVLRVSNFQANKPAMLRHLALYGDQFTRVRGELDKVYMEDIKPRYVTGFTEDSRGFLTSLRIDIPTFDEAGGTVMYTEYWTLDGLAVWQGYHNRATSIDQLGEPREFTPLAAFGIDFIPVVHTKFKNTGDNRGQSCVYHALDKIYEANRLATRLNDLQFRHNKPIWAALANSVDKDGRPMPAPRIKVSGNGANATATEEEKETVLGDVVYMPGASTLQPLIPSINYEHALAILNAQMEELEEDLPELRYYSIRDSGQLSGEAIGKLLGAAVDRALEARNNFTESLKRINMMALTIGIFLGIYPATLGTFDGGSFEHDIVIDAMFGETLEKRAATLKTLTDAGVPLPVAMKETGFSDEQITQAIKLQRPQPTAPRGENADNVQ